MDLPDNFDKFMKIFQEYSKLYKEQMIPIIQKRVRIFRAKIMHKEVKNCFKRANVYIDHKIL
jgi:hypothetical protein